MINIPSETLTRTEIKIIMKILYKRLNAFEAERRMTDKTMLAREAIDFWPLLATNEAIVLNERRYKIEEYSNALKEAILQCKKARGLVILPGDKVEVN
jgi:hypothetical protein